ncbi:MAG: DUF6171 family protein [Treponema sp.]|nr:DUF6171 family protein [Treponema sp.]
MSDSHISADSRQGAWCPQCELHAQMAAITPESIRAQAEAQAFVPGITADSATYARRLKICASCPKLVSEMLCSECGSYVAFRARLEKARCPFPANDKWQQQEGII